MSTNSYFKYPYVCIFSFHQGFTSVPRWSTSLPFLLVSQCLISLPWGVRFPLPPTNMRAMRTLLNVKPIHKCGARDAEQSGPYWGGGGNAQRPRAFADAEGTSGHFQSEMNCKPLHWPRTPAQLPWSLSHQVPATHPFQSLSQSNSFHSLARTLLSLFLLKFLIIHVFIFPDEI